MVHNKVWGHCIFHNRNNHLASHESRNFMSARKKRCMVSIRAVNPSRKQSDQYFQINYKPITAPPHSTAALCGSGCLWWRIAAPSRTTLPLAATSCHDLAPRVVKQRSSAPPLTHYWWNFKGGLGKRRSNNSYATRGTVQCKSPDTQQSKVRSVRHKYSIQQDNQVVF
jgi:hypothetical protein